MPNPKKILNSPDELNENQLKDYLKGKLSADEMDGFEKQMAESPFVNDAVEGLQNFSSEQKMQEYVKQLNKNLHQHLNHKQQWKNKNPEKNFPWILFSVILVLLLCFLAFVVITWMKM